MTSAAETNFFFCIAPLILVDYQLAARYCPPPAIPGSALSFPVATSAATTMSTPLFHSEWMNMGVSRFRVRAYEKPSTMPSVTSCGKSRRGAVSQDGTSPHFRQGEHGG